MIFLRVRIWLDTGIHFAAAGSADLPQRAAHQLDLARFLFGRSLRQIVVLVDGMTKRLGLTS